MYTIYLSVCIPSLGDFDDDNGTTGLVVIMMMMKIMFGGSNLTWWHVNMMTTPNRNLKIVIHRTSSCTLGAELRWTILFIVTIFLHRTTPTEPE